MRLDIEEHGRVTVVRPEGPQITLRSGVSEVRDLLLERLRTGTRYIVLDLSNVEYVDSALLGALLSAHKEMAREPGEVILSSAGEAVAEALRLTGVDREFRSYEKVGDAVNSLR